MMDPRRSPSGLSTLVRALVLALVRALALALVLASTAPGSARAQSPEESFKQGIVKFDEGDCETALPLFEAAYQGTQSPNARLYVARCLAQLERYVDAYREMAGTLELAREKAEEEAKYAQTRDAAAAELAQLEPKVGKLVVAFDAPYDGASILVDGREIPEAEQGVPVPVAPGDVQVVARAPDKEEYTTTVEVEAGQSYALAIVLEDSAPAGGEPEEIDEEGPGLGTLRIVGIVVAGVGVGGMVAFAVTGSMASSKFSEVDEACGGETCPDLTYVDDIDSGKTLQTVANVSLGLGIAFMVGGAAMIIFGGPSDDAGDEAEASLELVPTVAPALHGDRVGGATIGVTGRF